MTTFTSGQASRPDFAPLALLPGQLKNCLCIYPASDDSAPAPQSLSLPTKRNSQCISPVPWGCCNTRERGRDGLPPARRSCLQGDHDFLQPYVFALEQKVRCHIACASPGICLGLPVPSALLQHGVLQPVWFFCLFVCFLAWGKSYKFMGKHS